MKSLAHCGVNGPAKLPAAASSELCRNYVSPAITIAGALGSGTILAGAIPACALFLRTFRADIRAMWTPNRDSFHLPATLARHARIVEEGFWTKLLKLAGHIPFAEDLAAAYFCVIDPATPGRVRGILLAALAWFVLPAAVMPEFVVVLGFTNEIAVTAIAVRMIRKHLKERHYVRARMALHIPEPPAEQ
jgi:uncharacterized membrane protein YkvA (DUF1232 family)